MDHLAHMHLLGLQDANETSKDTLGNPSRNMPKHKPLRTQYFQDITSES